MQWQQDLPDVSKWQPDSGHAENLKNGLLLTCQAAQQRIVAEGAIEQRFNIYNYDSGPGLEDIVRQELLKLLPDRYSIDPGVVNDRDGRTAGEADVLIRNKTWAPAVKLGATPDSRRFHFPVESIYSAIEVKQTLGFHELDVAMEKLVKISRLNRPANPYGHITENQHMTFLDQASKILNPLHTTVLGTKLKSGLSFSDIARRFGEINASLNRSDMVSALCLFDQGIVLYLTKEEDFHHVHASYMWDRQAPLVMGIYDQPDKAFYVLFIHLMGHLTRSVLGVHDLNNHYGNFQATNKLIHYEGALFNQFNEQHAS